MLRSHIFLTALYHLKLYLKNREKSEKIGTPGKIHNQMVNSMLIVRNLWIWTYRRFHLSVDTWRKNMFSLDIKRGMFGRQTFEVWRPLNLHSYVRDRVSMPKFV